MAEAGFQETRDGTDRVRERGWVGQRIGEDGRFYCYWSVLGVVNTEIRHPMSLGQTCPFWMRERVPVTQAWDELQAVLQTILRAPLLHQLSFSEILHSGLPAPSSHETLSNMVLQLEG